MSDMVCSLCHRFGIYWKSLTGPSPYTYCPHCGSTNCQEAPEPAEGDE